MSYERPCFTPPPPDEAPAVVYDAHDVPRHFFVGVDHDRNTWSVATYSSDWMDPDTLARWMGVDPTNLVMAADAVAEDLLAAREGASLS